MSPPAPGRSKRVRLLDEAVDTMRALAWRSPVVLREVLRRLKQLDEGSLRPQPLHDFAKTGDLTDCGTIVVAAAGESEHRIVVRDVEGGFHVSEVAVEDRSQDLPYLLAGLRLGRIHDPVRRSDAQRRILGIRKLLGGEDR